MATDPRLELARRMIASGQAVSPSSPVSLQQRAAQQYAAYASRKKTKTVADASPGGWKGIVAAALDNPVAKTLLAPLQAADLGRSTIISGIKELGDAIDFNENTKASFGEFKQQAKDHIGFGDVIRESGGLGNKWLDRIAGFVGDVAFDPLTYLTLGTGHLAGMAGRAGLAADIATQGAKNVAAGKITQEALDEIVQRAGKYGVGRLNAAERAAYNLPEEGLRFMGRKVQGTEAVARAAGKAFSGVRVGATDSELWGKVFRDSAGQVRRAPDNLTEAFTKLATGRGGISASQAATHVAAVNAKAAQGGAFAGTWGRVAHSLWKDVKDKGMRQAVTNLVESGNLSDPVAAATAKWFEDVRLAHAAATGREIAKRENYVPHMWAGFGRKLLAGDTEVGRDLRKILTFTEREVNDLGHALERKIEAGTYKIAGKDVTFATGTIDDINRTMQRAFPDVVGTKNVLLDDMTVIMGNYAKSVGEDVGNAALLSKLKQNGVALEGADALKRVVDEKATKEANSAAAAEFQKSLKKGEPAFKQALADARSSAAETVKHVGATLKLRLAGMRKTDSALLKQWEALHNKLIKNNLDFDVAMNDIMDRELALQAELDKFVRLQDEAARSVEADIAAAGEDLKMLSKDRLARRREAIARRDAAAARVEELQAHIDAYRELGDTVKKLKDDIAVGGVLKPGDLPDEVRDTLRQRTVKEQRLIDESGRAAATEEVDAAVRLGTKGDEAYGLSRRLKINAQSAFSVLRGTMDNAGRVMSEDMQANLAWVKDFVDAFHSAGRRTFTDEQIKRAEQKAMKLADELRAEKEKLAFARENLSARSVANRESKVASLEASLERAYAEIAGGSAADAGFRSGAVDFKYDPNLPGSRAEQAERQINDFVKTGVESARQSALDAGFSAETAAKHADLFEKAYRAVDTIARFRNNPESYGGAYIVAAQRNLEEATDVLRVAVDYERRLSATLRGLQGSAVDVADPAVRAQVENLVMAEVLRSEKRALQVQKKELIDSLEHYASSRGGKVDEGLKRTKAYMLAKQDAEQAWEWVQPMLQELFDAVAEARVRVYEGAAREGVDNVNDFLENAVNVVGRDKAARDVYKQTVNDLKQSIMLAVWGGTPPKNAAAQLNVGRLLSKIDGTLGPKSKKAWIDEITRLRAGVAEAPGAKKAAQKAEQWFDLSSQAARRQVDVLDKKINHLDRAVENLTSSRPFGPKTKTVADDVARYTAEHQKVVDELTRLGRSGDKNTKEMLQLMRDYFATQIETLTTRGIPPKGPRLSADGVLKGQFRRVRSDVDKVLESKWAQLQDAEARMTRIMDKGTLAAKVADVPGGGTNFDRARRYIMAIDDEVGSLRARLKTTPKGDPMRKNILQYLKSLKDEKAALETAVKNAEPLEDRLASAKQLLQQEKDNVRSLTGKSQAEIEAASKVERLKSDLMNVVYGGGPAEMEIAGRRAELEVAKGGVRETFDATVNAVRNDLSAVEASRAEIERIVPAIEEVMRRLPKPRAGMKDADSINMVFEWLQESYDMIDPEGLVQRMMNMPEGMTPEMMKPGGLLGTVSNKEMAAFLKALPNDKDARIALSLIYKAHEDAGKLLTLVTDRAAEKQMMELAKEGKLFSVMSQVVKDGFEEIASSGVFVPEEVAAMMQRLATIDTGTGYKLLDVMNKYTDMWKAIKTTSPRFHIRNAMSATFMNYVAGVSTKNMISGARLFREFERDPVNWLKNVDPQIRPYAKRALDAVFASGGGQYAEIDNAANTLAQRGVFRYSKMKGTTVEGTVRMGMALDSVLPVELGGKALSADQAVSRVTKFHFNYSQLSQLDRKAKAFIPFWTFMSRNLPLQIEQMWLNPRAYAVYNNFVRNARDEKEGEVVPQWIKETGGFKLPFGEGLFATPDIGMNRVAQDIQMLRDPVRFGQNLNPVLKTALELYAGRQFYKDIPISGSKYTPLEGPRRVAQPLLELVGAVERGPDGQPVVSEKTNYALMQLLPGLQEAERLIAPSTGSYKERLGQSRLSFLTGAPVTKVGPKQILAEQLRQRRELEKSRAKKKAVRRATSG